MAKKNIRLIPKGVRTKLKTLGSGTIIAGSSVMYTAEEIAAGKLKHLGISLSGGKPVHQDSVLPDPQQGKYSYKNVNGEEIVRTDLPKETHYNYVDSPNWGDSYNGTHTVALPYEKYPRDFIGPRLAKIKVSIVAPRAGQSKYVFVFEVDRILDPKAKTFEQDLLEALNLLQENIGTCGIQKSDAKIEDYLRTLRVSWEVLPPGTREEAMARLFKGRQPSAEERKEVEERYDFLMSLQPQKLVYGTSGLERYFGGLIRTDLVVFENIQYGNAIYIMFEDWQKLSQRTRTELLSGRFGKNFERVTHGQGWKGEVRRIIKKRLEGKKK